MTTPLLTDLYQLTMAFGYWKHGPADREAVFHHSYRRAPFGDRAVLAAGAGPAIDFLSGLAFSDDDLAYLASLRGADDLPLFDPAFLDDLHSLDWRLTVHAVPEGEIVFPHEPLLRVQGPLLQCQLVETSLLNIVNFQTLVATKAARICAAAQGDPVIDFGLRRAQGPDGGLSASRAAFLGGCHGTSNVLAGQRFEIPVKGTHAHSWVMSFDSEQEAFDAYAEAMPNNTILLVDTYDTLEGVRHAIATGHKLRARGHDLLGIRLDSGDLASLSIEARALLDAAGFSDTKIVASNNLDEDSIRDLKARGARIDIWGVGTRLVTAYDQPALGGVYKLGALRDESGAWSHRLKRSDDPIKVSNPGILQVARALGNRGEIQRDVIYNEDDAPAPAGEPLLKLAMQSGRRCTSPEPLTTARERAIQNWSTFVNSPLPEVTLDPKLEAAKASLLRANGRAA